MKQRLIAVLGALLLTVPSAPATPQSPPPGSDPELEAGIQQVREGEFDAALITLDGVVRRLTAEQNPARAKDLSRAYLYLAVAYLRLNQTEAAKAQFLEALDLDNQLAVTAAEFPPGVVDLFAAVKAEHERARQPSAAVAAPTPPPPSGVEPAAEEPGEQIEPAAPEAKKKGGSKTLPILLGVGGAAGVAVAVGGGGSSSTSGPAPTPTPRGPISVRLSWSSSIDMDLHVIEPSGFEIYFGQPTSSTGGTFDQDVICSPGAETVSWNSAPAGTYVFWGYYNNNSDCNTPSPASFTITVYQGNSAVMTRAGSVSRQSETTRYSYVVN